MIFSIFVFILIVKIGFSSSGEICGEPPNASEIQESIQINLEAQPHELFTHPGSEMSVPIRVTNINPIEQYNLIVSFRERFTTSKRHVELVHSVLPKQLQLEGNSSSIVTIHFKIPQYIISGFRVKVTVFLTPISFQVEKVEMAFYFTVSDRALRNFDHFPPICVSSLHCDDSCLGNGLDCDAQDYWASIIYVKDNVTGLASVAVLTEGTNVTWSSFTIGTVKKTGIQLITNCCQRGAVIRVKDMAGNLADCILGENPNSSMQIIGEMIHLVTLICISTLVR